MPVNINTIFDAKSVDLHKLYSKTGSGFFIPIYQRQYTWNTKHIERMLTDVVSCIKRVQEHEDAVTFIGTVITVADKTGAAPNNEVISELPAEVSQVIDGQQRLTSYLIIIMAFYSLLTEEENNYKLVISKKLSKSLRRWIDSKLNNLKEMTQSSFSINQGQAGDVELGYNYYPKIIRSSETAEYSSCDTWCCYEDDANYVSPIAAFTKKFIDHYVSKVDGCTDFTYAPENSNDSVLENFTFSKQELRATLDDSSLFPIHNLDSDKKLLERFLNESSELSSDIESEDYEAASNILRVIMLGNFIMKRVVATHVCVSDDSYAFDMFEALNTTGEPLTAFETFKPKVVEFCRAEYTAGYSSSKEADEIKSIEKTLNTHRRADEKHKKTTALLQAFRLAYSGDSLGGHLSEQRRFLNNAFEETTDKLQFSQLLSSTWSFISDIWEAKEPNLLVCMKGDSAEHVMRLSKHPDIEKAHFCIKALKSANHRIVCGLFSDFYNQLKASGFSYEKLSDFIEVILATTAFFVRYRSYSSSTDGIDNLYRAILSEKVTKNVVPGRKVSDVKSSMRRHLQDKGRSDKDTWIHVVNSQDIYKNRKDLSKLMLLLSFESSSHDITLPGHLCDGVSSLDSYLTLPVWSEFHTVEHVWPQNPNSTWPTCLDSTRHLNAIGNLSILPLSENSIASNKDWDDKKVIYAILAEEKLNNKQKMVAEAQHNKVITANQADCLLKQSKLHPHIVALGNCVCWDASYVEDRGENLLERVWNKTEEWI